MSVKVHVKINHIEFVRKETFLLSVRVLILNGTQRRNSYSLSAKTFITRHVSQRMMSSSH